MINIPTWFSKGKRVPLVKSFTFGSANSPNTLNGDNLLGWGTIVCFHYDHLNSSPLVWHLHLSHSVKPQNIKIHFCHFVVQSCRIVWSRSSHKINPGLDMSSHGRPIVCKWRLGYILSEHIVCVKTKANPNAYLPSSRQLLCWQLTVGTVVFIMFVILLVNNSASLYCVYEAGSWQTTPDNVCIYSTRVSVCTVCMYFSDLSPYSQ